MLCRNAGRVNPRAAGERTLAPHTRPRQRVPGLAGRPDVSATGPMAHRSPHLPRWSVRRTLGPRWDWSANTENCRRQKAWARDNLQEPRVTSRATTARPAPDPPTAPAKANRLNVMNCPCRPNPCGQRQALVHGKACADQRFLEHHRSEFRHDSADDVICRSSAAPLYPPSRCPLPPCPSEEGRCLVQFWSLSHVKSGAGLEGHEIFGEVR